MVRFVVKKKSVRKQKIQEFREFLEARKRLVFGPLQFVEIVAKMAFT